jgi:putative redox protein
MGDLRVVEVEWEGGMRFRGGAPDGPKALVDAGPTREGPGPMLMLLVACAGCSGADVVSILEKAQVKLRKYHTEVRGMRADEHPKRYTSMHFVFTLAGDGLDESKARRAIDLSLTKYCSVVKSLAADLAVTYDLVLEP